MSTLMTSQNGVSTPAYFKQPIEGADPTVLTDIYLAHTNMVIWKRQLTNPLAQAAKTILAERPKLKTAMIVSPQHTIEALKDALGNTPSVTLLSEDIAQLVEMFCCLFDLEDVGLRLTALDSAMCPSFHVDKVPCRLVTTYHGVASEWIADIDANRNLMGQTDPQSKLIKSTEDIRQLNQGDVALLKGELWQGNEGYGLIHRSPQLVDNSLRLLLTLDFVNN